MKANCSFQHMKNPVRNSLNRSPGRRDLALIGLALAMFALSPAARATDRGNGNTSDGLDALLSLTTGSFNTGLGSMALETLTTASNNTATGAGALTANTSGHENTADGTDALQGNTTGIDNTATGVQALAANISGSSNTANGYQSLFSNTTGSSNTATGINALYFNKAGNYNTATGRGALYKNTASNNTATGYQALNNNTSGTYNTAHGTKALAANTTSNYNTALGYQALNASTGGYNTALGANALPASTTGSSNIAIGSAAGFYVTTGSNNIDIGSSGTTESGTMRLGTPGLQTNTYIAGIYGVTVPGGITMIVDSSGHLGTSTSSARFKENIQPMDNASEAILALKPVTFRYKHELDPEGIPQFGLVAEQVAKVNPDLVARDDQGKPYSVRYEAVNAMLLNEFLKEHRKVEQQEATITQLKSAVAREEAVAAQQQKDFQSNAAHQQKQIEALTASLQKVSAQVEMSKPASQMVFNNQ
jgi:trimeric autotransporter adhesin